MAYRFNPPPNWPIEDADWTPPPGWQPDPSWGPAPDGWNFWVQADEAPAVQEPTAQETAAQDHAAPEAAVQEPAADDDATRVASTGEQGSDQGSDVPAEPVVDDDATRVAHTGDQAPLGGVDHSVTAEDADDDATRVAGTDEQAPLDAPVADASGTGEARSAETAEYGGPDLGADLAQQTPYETGDAAGAAAAEAPAPAYGEPNPAPAYGQQSDAPAYGQQTEAPAYGQQAGAPEHGQQDHTSASSASQDYAGAQDYGSPQSYGSAQDYGSESGSDYPAPSIASYQSSPYGASPADPNGSGSQWTATTAPGDAPKKGGILRFWWIGCLVFVLIFALIAVVLGIFFFTRGGDDTPDPSAGPTTSQSPTDPATTDPTDPATTDPTDPPTSDSPLPTNLPTVDPSAKEVAVAGNSGKGTLKLDMKWMKPADLPNTYGGTVDPSSKAGGDYLVMTAELKVTDGKLTMNPFQFKITTPYGGEISPATASYTLKDGGASDSPDELSAGQTYSMRVLYEVEKAGGMNMVYDSFSDTYSWPVPAK